MTATTDATMIRDKPARIVLAFLALVTGGFQLVDGIHVLVKGKYLGPETPGPWRHVVAATGVDPFAMGPPFIALGVCWLAAATALLATSSICRPRSPPTGSNDDAPGRRRPPPPIA